MTRPARGPAPATAALSPALYGVFLAVLFVDWLLTGQPGVGNSQP